MLNLTTQPTHISSFIHLQNVVRVARRQANAQGSLPLSPCDSSGKLCAAAILVHSAIRLLGREGDLKRFEGDLFRNHRKDVIFGYAEKAGLPRAVVQAALVTNDAAKDADRLAAACTFFDRLLVADWHAIVS